MVQFNEQQQQLLRRPPNAMETQQWTLELASQCLRVKICGSALQYESAAGPQTPGKQSKSNANAASTCLPPPS